MKDLTEFMISVVLGLALIFIAYSMLGAGLVYVVERVSKMLII